MKLQTLCDYLAFSPLLAHLTPVDVKRLRKTFQSLTIKAGGRIVKEGDQILGMHLVVQGCVKFTARDANNEEVAVRTVPAPIFFGEDGLLDDQPRKHVATICALTDTTVILLSRKRFRSPTFARCEWATELLSQVSQLAAARASKQLTFAFRKFPLLANVPTTRISLLALLFSLEDRDAGRKVYQEGSLADSMYLVVSGRVKVMRRSSKQVIEIGALGYFGGDFLGDDVSRSATVVAMEPIRLLRLGRDVLNKFLQLVPESCKEVEERKWRRTADDLEKLCISFFASLDKRMFGMLAGIASLENVAAGVNVMEVGDRASACFLIVDGKVQVRSGADGADEADEADERPSSVSPPPSDELLLLSSGSYFGQESLVESWEGEAESVTSGSSSTAPTELACSEVATTCTECTLLRLEAAAVRRVLGGGGVKCVSALADMDLKIMRGHAKLRHVLRHPNGLSALLLYITQREDLARSSSVSSREAKEGTSNVDIVQQLRLLTDSAATKRAARARPLEASSEQELDQAEQAVLVYFAGFKLSSYFTELLDRPLWAGMQHSPHSPVITRIVWAGSGAGEVDPVLGLGGVGDDGGGGKIKKRVSFSIDAEADAEAGSGDKRVLLRKFSEWDTWHLRELREQRRRLEGALAQGYEYEAVKIKDNRTAYQQHGSSQKRVYVFDVDEGVLLNIKKNKTKEIPLRTIHALVRSSACDTELTCFSSNDARETQSSAPLAHKLHKLRLLFNSYEERESFASQAHLLSSSSSLLEISALGARAYKQLVVKDEGVQIYTSEGQSEDGGDLVHKYSACYDALLVNASGVQTACTIDVNCARGTLGVRENGRSPASHPAGHFHHHAHELPPLGSPRAATQSKAMTDTLAAAIVSPTDKLAVQTPARNALNTGHEHEFSHGVHRLTPLTKLTRSWLDCRRVHLQLLSTATDSAIQHVSYDLIMPNASMREQFAAHVKAVMHSSNDISRALQRNLGIGSRKDVKVGTEKEIEEAKPRVVSKAAQMMGVEKAELDELQQTRDIAHIPFDSKLSIFEGSWCVSASHPTAPPPLSELRQWIISDRAPDEDGDGLHDVYAISLQGVGDGAMGMEARSASRKWVRALEQLLDSSSLTVWNEQLMSALRTGRRSPQAHKGGAAVSADSKKTPLKQDLSTPLKTARRTKLDLASKQDLGEEATMRSQHEPAGLSGQSVESGVACAEADADAEAEAMAAVGPYTRVQRAAADVGVKLVLTAVEMAMEQELEQVLETPSSCKLFRSHLQKEFCEENLGFWNTVKAYKAQCEREWEKNHSANGEVCDGKGSAAEGGGGGGEGEEYDEFRDGENSGVQTLVTNWEELQSICEQAEKIYGEYLHVDSLSQVNLESSLVRKTRENMDTVTGMIKAAADARAGAQVKLNSPQRASRRSIRDMREGKRRTTGRRSIKEEEGRAEVAGVAGTAGANANADRLSEAYSTCEQTLRCIFDKPQAQIFSLMRRDAFPRFQRALAGKQQQAERTMTQTARVLYAAFRKHRGGLISEAEFLQIIELDARLMAMEEEEEEEEELRTGSARAAGSGLPSSPRRRRWGGR
jgi:CRP-like cAMP-binding protein